MTKEDYFFARKEVYEGVVPANGVYFTAGEAIVLDSRVAQKILEKDSALVEMAQD